MFLQRKSTEMYQLDRRVIGQIREGVEPADVMRVFNEAYAAAVPSSLDVYRTLTLCLAVKRSLLTLVRCLLDAGFPVDYKFGEASPSPLHVAVREGHVGIVSLLLERGAPVHVVSGATLDRLTTPSPLIFDLVGTAIELAVGANRLEMPFPGERYEHGLWPLAIGTAVELAVAADNVDIMTMLDERYDRGLARTKRTTLHLACQYGAYDCVERLLADPRVVERDLNSTDADDPHRPECFTPLLLAVGRHDARLVRTLLEHGASAAATTSRTGRTALHMAVSKCAFVSRSDVVGRDLVVSDLPEVVRLLVDAGTDVDAVHDGGDTATSLLCSHVVHEFNLLHVNDLHRRTIVAAVGALVDAAADVNIAGTQLPMGVLMEQLFLVVQRLTAFDSGYSVSGCDRAVQALRLAGDLCALLLDRAKADPNLENTFRRFAAAPGGPAQSLPLVLARVCILARRTRCYDSLHDVFSLLIDILRLLRLSGGKVDDYEPLLRLVDVDVIKHTELLVKLFDFADEPEARSAKCFLMKIKDNTKDDGVKDRVQAIIDGVFGSMRTLMHMSRRIVLRSVIRSGHGPHSCSKLGLPKQLENFLESSDN